MNKQAYQVMQENHTRAQGEECVKANQDTIFSTGQDLEDQAKELREVVNILHDKLFQHELKELTESECEPPRNSNIITQFNIETRDIIRASRLKVQKIISSIE